MAKVKHTIKNVRLESEGWSGLCSCGKWACVAPTARKLRSEHKEHVKFQRSLGN